MKPSKKGNMILIRPDKMSDELRRRYNNFEPVATERWLRKSIQLLATLGKHRQAQCFVSMGLSGVAVDGETHSSRLASGSNCFLSLFTGCR